ncbi:MAG: cysteine desulfurase [Bacteroidia bacterium]|nr:cysteine desulfurase [Bacteroidia bacterium]
MSFPVYLDYNATTPVLSETMEVVLPLFTRDFGNASSNTHRYGFKAADLVKKSREQLASILNCEPNELYFNSGSTEGINTALKGLFWTHAAKGKHFISVKTEHKAVLDCLDFLETQGAEISWLEVGKDGRIQLDELQKLIRPDTIAVCVMLANNETGVIQDIESISALVHQAGSKLVCDATQAVGKIPVDIKQLGVDVLAFSGHKCYAMKGIGGLFVRRKNPRVSLPPLLHGGGHENGLRSGTLNVPGIVSLATSLQLVYSGLTNEIERQKKLQQILEDGLQRLGCLTVASQSPRLPNTTMALLPGIKAEKLITQLPGFAFSTGSACTSAIPKPSHVLVAMGYMEQADSAIRISLGRMTQQADIEAFLNALGLVL